MIARVNSKAFGRADEEGLNRGGDERPGADEASEGQIWLTSVDVAAKWSLCVGTIRAYADSGRLPCHRLPGKFSHRRFALTDCERVLGVPRVVEEEKSGVGGNRPCAVYSRVSTSKQAAGLAKGDESDLTRQIFRLTDHAKAIHSTAPKVYSDVGSGLSWRKGLEQLLKAVLRDELKGGVIYCTFRDRLSRFDVATKMFEAVCKEKDVELVFVDNEEARTAEDMGDLVLDLTAVICCFNARLMGRRAAKTLKAPLSPETIQEALKMKGEGMLPCQIAKILRGKGHRNEKGRLVNEYSILSLFENVGDSLDGLLGEEKPTNSFEEWASANLVKDESARGHVYEIHGAYSAWCDQQGKTPLSNIAVQRFLRDTYGWSTYKAKKVYCVRMEGGAQ